jgi:hypothetical protein
METLPPDVIESLKKLAKWSDFQQKFTKWSLIALIPFVLLLAGIAVWAESRTKKITERVEPVSWYQVSTNMRSGDLSITLAIANQLIEKIHWITKDITELERFIL